LGYKNGIGMENRRGCIPFGSLVKPIKTVEFKIIQIDKRKQKRDKLYVYEISDFNMEQNFTLYPKKLLRMAKTMGILLY
jgi:hypothetical protein